MQTHLYARVLTLIYNGQWTWSKGNFTYSEFCCFDKLSRYGVSQAEVLTANFIIRI